METTTEISFHRKTILQTILHSIIALQKYVWTQSGVTIHIKTFHFSEFFKTLIHTAYKDDPVNALVVWPDINASIFNL